MLLNFTKGIDAIWKHSRFVAPIHNKKIPLVYTYIIMVERQLS